MLSVLNIVLVFLLVLANGFFVASEFALVGVRRSRVASLAEAGDRRARRLLGLIDNLNAYISATQLGITLASLALGWLGEPAVAHLLEKPLAGRVSEAVLHTISFAVAFGIITFLHIVLGELAPKTLALERAEKTALAIALPMQLFYRTFYYPIRLLDWAGTRVVRLFGLHPSGEHGAIYTEDELRQIIAASQRGGHIEEGERRLLDRVFAFGDAEVREAMIPRTQVEALPANATLEEARARFRETGYSRLPVYRERLDNVVGLLFRKDLDMGQVSPEGFDLAKLARPATFIPATATLGAALAQMQKARIHFVFVIDEHGGIEGVLTLEDLLEEIVGEIDDEYDEEARSQIAEQPDGTCLLDGMLAVRDANQRLSLALPEDEHYTTLAGFLMAKAGRVLKAGETVEHDGASFAVERVEGLRIRRVRFAPAAAGRQDENGALPRRPAGGHLAALPPLACGLAYSLLALAA
ncbi:MAG TPA: hemolysin family protein [Pyrinomonadaceae bacterium]|nr:hemolysin family protein [Pyrinomonadaceae bacterium]